MCLCWLLAPPLSAQVGRCYDISTGEWFPIDSTHRVEAPRPERPDLSADSVIYSLPVRVRLDSVPSPYAPEAGNMVFSVPVNTLQVPHRWRSWRSNGDSLRLVLSTGYSGTVTQLVRSGGGWEGNATTFSDNRGFLRFLSTVRLEPTDCEVPPAIPATADRPLLRSITLTSGKRLALGEPLPAGTDTQPRRSGALTVLDDASGRWMGTDTIVALVNRQGLVSRIELRYPEGFDLGPALQSLEAEYRSGNTWGDANWWSWRNRTTTMSLRLDHRPRLTLEDPRRR